MQHILICQRDDCRRSVDPNRQCGHYMKKNGSDKESERLMHLEQTSPPATAQAS